MDYSELLVYENDLAACYEAEYLLTLQCSRASLSLTRQNPQNGTTNGIHGRAGYPFDVSQHEGVLFKKTNHYTVLNSPSRLKEHCLEVCEPHSMDTTCGGMDPTSITAANMARKRHFNRNDSFSFEKLPKNGCLPLQSHGEDPKDMETGVVLEEFPLTEDLSLFPSEKRKKTLNRV